MKRQNEDSDQQFFYTKVSCRQCKKSYIVKSKHAFTFTLCNTPKCGYIISAKDPYFSVKFRNEMK